MKEAAIDCERAIIAHYQSAEVTEPGDRAFYRPAPFVAPQCAPVLQPRFRAVLAMRCNELDATASQPLTQPVAVVAFVRDHSLRFLSRPPRPMPASDTDRGERRLREFDLRRGRRVKVVSQRNTLA